MGKSTGAGSISVFTHNLKDFEFLPYYKIGQYEGMAARVGAGLESWELYDYMALHNMTVVVPGAATVGAYGGWMLGGGHSNLASKYGLGADQVLSLQVVTADGRFVTADPNTNQDLFWAMRGGGPSKYLWLTPLEPRTFSSPHGAKHNTGTYGIVTSAIVKAYLPTKVYMSALNFTTTGLSDISTFWKGVDAFFLYSKFVVEAGATSYSYVSPQGNNSYSFTNEFEFPGVTPKSAFDFLQPLYDYINSIGIVVVNPEPVPSARSSSGKRGIGDSPGNSRFASRLFPRQNWEDDELFAKTMGAIRETVEAGYAFHGVHMSPTEEIAGYPGRDSGANPALRNTVMHADVFDSVAPGAPAAVVMAASAKLNLYMDKMRAVTPRGGAYVNEADRLEPNWQQSFFGANYPRLLGIKREIDPWEIFWAPTTVGSEGWEVRTSDGLPTQNGPLCRVGAA